MSLRRSVASTTAGRVQHELTEHYCRAEAVNGLGARTTAWRCARSSVDASVRIEAKDCAGLERLARYCARPVFASERLSWAREGERLRYRLPKPRADGQTVLELTPFELLDRLAVLIPPPRRHRHRYHIP